MKQIVGGTLNQIDSNKKSLLLKIEFNKETNRAKNITFEQESYTNLPNSSNLFMSSERLIETRILAPEIMHHRDDKQTGYQHPLSSQIYIYT